MHQAQQAVQVCLQMNALQSVIREQMSEVMQIEHRPQHVRNRSQKSKSVKQ